MLDRPKKSFGSASKSVQMFKKSLFSIKGLIVAFAGSLSAIKLVQFADELNLARSKINLFAEDQENLIDIQAKIKEVCQRFLYRI